MAVEEIDVDNSEYPLLTTVEAAKLLRTNEETLKISRSNGILWGKTRPEYLKLGRKVLYKREVLLKWVDDNATII